MKLFIREQLPVIFIYIVQLFVISFIYWLDGYRNLTIILYAVLLSSCLLIGYLAFRYITHRTFYKRLERPLESIEAFMNDDEQAPLAVSLRQLLKNQYRHYKADLLDHQMKLDDHIRFINQWVHQMKTPLSVIQLTIQDDDDQRTASIRDELDRLKKGLETVLYTARLGTFEHDFYVENLNLENVVRSAASHQKRLFIRKNVFPSLQIDEKVTIASDVKWLSFVISQLITNAVRYTVEENRKIYFHGYKRETQAVLEIRDEGVGIPESDLSRVFDPYFTGENGRDFDESTGMGLYLVKQICEKLGHQVELQSEVGKGTIVRLLF